MALTGIDFSTYITDRTQDFTGREWVFAEIDRPLSDPGASRFFVITGEPAIGASAVAARLTQICDPDAYHFCVAHESVWNKPLHSAPILIYGTEHGASSCATR